MFIIISIIFIIVRTLYHIKLDRSWTHFFKKQKNIQNNTALLPKITDNKAVTYYNFIL